MIEPFGVWHPLVVIGEGTANGEQELVRNQLGRHEGFSGLG